MDEFLKKVYLGNTISDYLNALIIFAACVLIISILKKFVTRAVAKWSKKTGSRVDNILVKLLQRFIVPFVYYAAFYYSIKSLTLIPKVENLFDTLSALILTFIVVRLIISIINYLLNAYFRKQDAGSDKQKQIKGIGTIVSILVWGLGVVFVLDNLGLKISAVVTGLGIGGVAVALAAQAVLKDFFSYFVIFFDRPFEIGDFITVGDNSGTVEQIGIKTTKVRALSGEQIIFANATLTDTKIHNFKRMQTRRVAFKIGVTYKTEKGKLEEIPSMIKDIINSQPNVTFDRAHFSTLGDSALMFEVVYFINSSDYNEYMNIQQAINLKLIDEFGKKGIEFAYPTQTVFISKENDS